MKTPLATVPAALQAACLRVDAWPLRDRRALLAGGLAVLAAVELHVVWGLHERRLDHIRQQQEPAIAQAQSRRLAAEQQRQRLAQVRHELAQGRQDVAHGAVLPPQEVFAALRRTLVMQGLQVLSLEALSDADSGPLAPNDVAGAPALYRHRAALRFSGALADVTRALHSFDQPTMPMRLERVRVAAAVDAATAVEASLVLVTVNQERTWLAL